MTLNSCADRFGGSSDSLVSLGGLALLPPPSPRDAPDVDLGLFEAAVERVRLRSMVQQVKQNQKGKNSGGLRFLIRLLPS